MWFNYEADTNRNKDFKSMVTIFFSRKANFYDIQHANFNFHHLIFLFLSSFLFLCHTNEFETSPFNLRYNMTLLNICCIFAIWDFIQNYKVQLVKIMSSLRWSYEYHRLLWMSSNGRFYIFIKHWKGVFSN